ncbi:MAG: DEAD/DEAH box helicase [Clostridia bacterium]|nr:DEAD/DEAH box helicase [Clostridia bacterium]
MFNHLNLSEEILKALESKGFENPTEIQEKCIPLIFAGRDIFGRSKTGSGKTFAFSLPAIDMVDVEMPAVQVLIVCPTRELAVQVADETRKATLYKEACAIACVYGGASMINQITALKRAKIVVGTPGRLMDHLRRRTLRLNNVKLVVLDEADVMLNMGFREDIETILISVPRERQTVMFSATMPPAIKAITKMYLKNPEYVEIGELNTTLVEIEQSYVRTNLTGKRQAIVELFQKLSPQSSIVFCNTKRMTDIIARVLTTNGFNAQALNGDMRQAERKRTLDAFKAHTIDVLVASDVAARGLDIDNLDYIFNYDLPLDVEYYIHRMGRTGRAGKSGSVITLINNSDELITLKKYKQATKSDLNEHKLSQSLSTFEDIVGEKAPEKSVIYGASAYKSKTGKFIPFAKRSRR